MKKEIDDYISVTHTMGGVMDFINEGIYHNNLKIFSTRYDKVWRIKLKEDNQKGSLRVNRKIVYSYIFEDGRFRVQEIENEIAVSEWIDIGVNVIMVD